MTQLRSFIDRVLRLKAEQDKLTSDIREVYAEAKAARLDKTIMGQLVVYLRKREKDPLGCEEKEAIFDVYLHEYNKGAPSTHKNTRAHEAATLPPHDEDGVIIESTEPSPNGEASSAAASQGQAAHAGTGSETLASHEGISEGEGASVLSPPIPQPAASSPATVEPVSASLSSVPGSLPDLPAFLNRRDLECAVRVQ